MPSLSSCSWTLRLLSNQSNWTSQVCEFLPKRKMYELAGSKLSQWSNHNFEIIWVFWTILGFQKPNWCRFSKFLHQLYCEKFSFLWGRVFLEAVSWSWYPVVFWKKKQIMKLFKFCFSSKLDTDEIKTERWWKFL